MRIRNSIVAVLAIFSLLAGVLGLAGCGSSPVNDGKPPYGDIRNLATGLAFWHFNSTSSISGILAGADNLKISLSADDLNHILDEDEKKRMHRIHGVEHSVLELYGVRAMAEFRVRHDRAVADLWVEAASREGLGSTLGRADLLIAAQYLQEAADNLAFLPSAWYCWAPAGCDITEVADARTMIPMSPGLHDEGMAAVEELTRFSQSASPRMDELMPIREKISTWEGKVHAALEALP
jgi:hypothetical protein